MSNFQRLNSMKCAASTKDSLYEPDLIHWLDLITQEMCIANDAVVSNYATDSGIEQWWLMSRRRSSCLGNTRLKTVWILMTNLQWLAKCFRLQHGLSFHPRKVSETYLNVFAGYASGFRPFGPWGPARGWDILHPLHFTKIQTPLRRLIVDLLYKSTITKQHIHHKSNQWSLSLMQSQRRSQ